MISTGAASRRLFRTMKDDGAGRPRLREDASSLGIRTDGSKYANLDLHLDEDGQTWTPQQKPEGLSVQINDPRTAPPFHLPKTLGGTSKGELWEIAERVLPELLHVVPDARKVKAQAGHAVLEARRRCLLTEYRDALAASQPNWRKSDVNEFR